MKEYESPKAELIEFDRGNVIATSGCNCYMDVRANDMDTDENCWADTYGAEELTLHDQPMD